MPYNHLLLRLADHLDTGKLGHAKFYFGFFNSGHPYRHHDEKRWHNCAHAGCGLGECPFIFPAWYFNAEWLPVINRETSPLHCAKIFFRLDNEGQAKHLFVPGFQKPELYGGKLLDKYASKEDVAKGIRDFCEHIPF
jgi:hypothetical protein